MEPSGQPPTPSSEPPAVPAEVRQRWRLTYRRRGDAPALAQRDQVAAWEVALVASGLPVAGLDLPVPRPRVVFGAPLAVGMAADGELLDVFLVERRPVADVRERLSGSLPPGHELVDAYDVWLGEPPISGRVVAADYLVLVEASRSEDPASDPEFRAALERGAQELFAASTIPRTRDKGGRAVAYDLRPLLDSIAVPETAPDATAGSVAIRIRTRFDPERGVGRPEEVVAALGVACGVELEVRSLVRQRLILGGDRSTRSGTIPA